MMKIAAFQLSVILTAGAAVLISACSAPISPTTAAASPTLPPVVRASNRPTVTPIATPTPSVPPSPTPDPRIMATFPPDVNPLTGEKVSDPAVLNRRPLAIKIGDSIEQGVRPQAGASLADWVIEHETEGGIPRWTAIFYTNTPPRVGGVRSCRIIDYEIPAIFKSLLACSGMSGGTREFYIRPSDFNQEKRFLSPDFGDWHPMFYRLDTAPVPHNLFADPAEIWKEADKRGADAKPDLSGLVFATKPITPGRPTGEIKLKYGSETELWKYDPTATTCSSTPGCWLRWSAGVPHTDALNGQQLSAANVIVVHAYHAEDKRYFEEDYGAFKAFGLQIQLWGSGPVRIFHDGQEFGGTWNRENRNDMLKFLDPSGQPIPLRPGRTWVELVNLGAQVEVKP